MRGAPRILIIVPMGLLLGYYAAKGGRTPQPSIPSTFLEAPQRGAGAASYDVLVVPSMEKVLPDARSIPGATVGPAQVSLARNESESVQVVLRSRTPLRAVQVTVSELRQVGGTASIPSAAVTWSPVGFVKTRRPDYAVSHVGWWPDPLPAGAPFNVKPGWLQPLWVTVDTAPDTPPGTYDGMLTIQPADGPTAHVELKVTVWDFVLPRTPSLPSAFDLYPNRLESGYSRFFPTWWAAWESRTGELTERFYDALMRARLAPMLHIAPAEDGALEQLERFRERGLSAFVLGRLGGSFDNHWPDEPAELAQLELQYREDAHRLREAGLLDRHYVYLYDEPEPGLPQVAAVARMIHRADPALKTLVTLKTPVDPERLAGWLRDIDVVCLRNVIVDPATVARLQQLGKEIWLYVSGPTPPYPSLVIDQPAMASRILPWMCWKYGFRGLLYWCVNYWTTDPYREPMNTPWQQNGNGSLFYPGPDGPISSIRLELLRDGMEDYEYLVRLQDLVRAARSESAAAPALIAQAERLLQVDSRLVSSPARYATDPEVLLARRRAIAETIEQLGSEQHEAGR